MKGGIHSLDQKMIRRWYSSADLEDLLENRTSRGQSFDSETALLGIFGISGLASGLGNITGASGWNRHAKRGKGLERREEMNKNFGCLRIPFYSAGPSHERGAYACTRGVQGSEIVIACVIRSVDTIGVRGAFSRTRGVLRITPVTRLRIMPPSLN